MVGGCIADDWNFMPQTINLVLFGKTGNGKSASGNSILGRNAFVSKPSIFGLTRTCELQSTKLKDGRILNVIDTPGTRTQLFYSTCKRIVECVDLAKDSIHAVLAVFSVRSCHSTEEDAAIENLKNLFGETILKYMIVVFTGGDDLESSGLSLEEFIGQNMHRSLQKFIQSCNRRIILFDNKTCDEGKRGKQLEVLMDNVDTVLADNSGKPFSDYIFDELKEGALILHQREKEIESMKGCSEQQLSAMKEEIYKSYRDQLAGITEKESIASLQIKIPPLRILGITVASSQLCSLQVESRRLSSQWAVAALLTTGTSCLIILIWCSSEKPAMEKVRLEIAFWAEMNSCQSLACLRFTCELHSTKLKDGRVLNVIDTPGLFDLSHKAEATSKQIVRCVHLAKDGIHAILMVLSIRSRLSPDEEAAIKNLKNLFGEKILDHMIEVFTGGDDLESSGQSLEEFIGHETHRSLEKLIQSCNRRIVLFDNKTCDEGKRANQLEGLMHFVDTVVADNFGKPFSDDIFDELKEGALLLHQREKEVESMKGWSEQQLSALEKEIYKAYHDQLARITEMVEQKLKQTVEELEKRLAEEQATRLEAEKNFDEARFKSEEARLKFEEARLKSEEARIKSEEEIRKLREKLEQAQRDSEEFQKRVESNKTCAIL